MYYQTVLYFDWTYETKATKNNKNVNRPLKQTKRTPFVRDRIKPTLARPAPAYKFKSHQTNTYNPHNRDRFLAYISPSPNNIALHAPNKNQTERIQIETNEARIKTRTSKIISIKGNKTRARARQRSDRGSLDITQNKINQTFHSFRASINLALRPIEI